MSVIVSHPTGNPNVRAVLRGLEAHGLLSEFWTTIHLPGAIQLKQYLPDAFQRELDRRHFPEVSRGKICTRPQRELIRQIARRAGFRGLISHETGWASIHKVYYDLDRRVARALTSTDCQDCEAIYAYEDGAKNSFTAARRLGIACIYDLPSPYWKFVSDLLLEEADRWPNWKCTMDGLIDSDQNRARKDEELFLSEMIVVASSFSKKMLDEHANVSGNVCVIPYGTPTPIRHRPAVRMRDAPLRIFYAGRLSQSKGVADLLSALSKLDFAWQITIAGSLPQSLPAQLSEFLARDNVNYLGFVAHATLMKAMSESHVFVFPSLYEGFGMVITEAMASGLPVITTSNTAGPDILTDGESGFIIPIRAPEAIAERLTWLNEDETLRQRMATSTLDTAARIPWSLYEERVAQLVNKTLAT
jgi:hypothetical protein